MQQEKLYVRSQSKQVNSVQVPVKKKLVLII